MLGHTSIGRNLSIYVDVMDEKEETVSPSYRSHVFIMSLCLRYRLYSIFQKKAAPLYGLLTHKTTRNVCTNMGAWRLLSLAMAHFKI